MSFRTLPLPQGVRASFSPFHNTFQRAHLSCDCSGAHAPSTTMPLGPDPYGFGGADSFGYHPTQGGAQMQGYGERPVWDPFGRESYAYERAQYGDGYGPVNQASQNPWDNMAYPGVSAGHAPFNPSSHHQSTWGNTNASFPPMGYGQQDPFHHESRRNPTHGWNDMMDFSGSGFSPPPFQGAAPNGPFTYDAPYSDPQSNGCVPFVPPIHSAHSNAFAHPPPFGQQQPRRKSKHRHERRNVEPFAPHADDWDETRSFAFVPLDGESLKRIKKWKKSVGSDPPPRQNTIADTPGRPSSRNSDGSVESLVSPSAAALMRQRSTHHKKVSSHKSCLCRTLR